MRYFILLLAVVLSAPTTAQIKKGTRQVITKITSRDIQFRPQYAPAIAGGVIQELPNVQRSVADFGGSYGVALRDNIVVGGAVQANLSFGENGTGLDYLMVCPWGRYYPYNEPELQGYGQLQTGLTYVNDEFEVLSRVIASAGVHLPVGNTLQITPNLSYAIQDGSNELGLGAQLEYHFSGEETEEPDPTDKFRTGTVRLGGGLVRTGYSDRVFRIGTRVGWQYSIQERWAVGTDIGYSYDRTTFDNGSSGGSKPFFRTSDLSLGLNTRYYVAPDQRVSYYGEAGAGYVSSNFKASYSGGRESDGFGYLRLGAGAQLLACENVVLEAGPEFRLDLYNESSLACGLLLGMYFLFGGLEAE